jgi:drug/metabolite transporter superfamily protein YnfA
MIYAIIALFAVAAVFGLIILVNWMKSQGASNGVVYTHGILAALGLVLLIAYAVQHPDHSPMTAIIIFLVAALGGIYMFVRDLMKKNSPMWLAVVHALLAVGAFVTLLVFAFV